jgi:hypothetical protein|tara:strand:- start:2013 stop:2198 length:186 start_codon:yes stop_codon:yes gene_type:complete
MSLKWNFPIFRAIVGKGPVTWRSIFKLIVVGWGIKILIFNVVGILFFDTEPFPLFHFLFNL